MSLLSSLFGFQSAGRAGAAIAGADVSAANNVSRATQSGLTRIDDSVNNANTGVNSAGQTAQAIVNEKTGDANTTLQGLIDKINGTYSPFVQGGQTGIEGLEKLANGPKFSFNPSDLQNDPGYQFQLQEGSDAINNSASAKGTLQSGNTLKALTQYGQGLAGTYFNDAFNRAKGTFDTNQSSTLAALTALTGAGLQGTNASTGQVSDLTKTQASNTVNSGIYAGNVDTSLAQFLASLGLQGAQSSADLGLKGATTSSGFISKAGEGTAAGILGQGKAASSAVDDIGGILSKIPGLGLGA